MADELKQTPSQTVGPFYKIGLYSDHGSFARIFDNDLTTPGVAGQRIRIEGTIHDGAGEPIPDALLEIWQADSEGRHRSGERTLNDGFTGFGRASTEAGGRFSLTTILPGKVPGPDGSVQAPHLLVIIYMRGLLVHAFTRIYFDDQSEANAKDPILALVPEDRRPTLIARRRHGHGGPVPVYDFDIKMQGDDETVFFDV